LRSCGRPARSRGRRFWSGRLHFPASNDVRPRVADVVGLTAGRGISAAERFAVAADRLVSAGDRHGSADGLRGCDDDVGFSTSSECPLSAEHLGSPLFRGSRRIVVVVEKQCQCIEKHRLCVQKHRRCFAKYRLFIEKDDLFVEDDDVFIEAKFHCAQGSEGLRAAPVHRRRSTAGRDVASFVVVATDRNRSRAMFSGLDENPVCIEDKAACFDANVQRITSTAD
jgi:hypothetical protein